MRIRQRARFTQKRRWKPCLADIVRKTIRKNMPQIVANITRNNALFRALIRGEPPCAAAKS